MRRLLVLLPLFAACGPKPLYVEPPARADVVVTPGTAVVTWEKGLNAQATLIARTIGSVDATRPDGGMVGDGLGGGVIVHVSEGTSFTDTNLPDSCGPFAWHLWSQGADGTWAKTAATVRSLRGAHTIAPTEQVTALSTAFEGNLLRLSWRPPDASSSFQGVTVIRKRGAAPTSVSDGTIVYAGPSSMTTELLSNLSSNEPTFYGVFNCNTCGKCGASAPSVAVTAPGDGGANLAVSGLTAALSADGRRVELAWTTSAPRVKVLRTLNGSASGPDDSSAVVVFDGAGTTASEPLDALLPDQPLSAQRYTYSAWACVDATCSTSPTTAPFSFTLKQALRAGGYTLFFRHATAGTCVDALALGPASSTSTPGWWKRCDATCATATAAQLTPGVADAELAAVRDFFVAQGLVVGRALSSEFCRAVSTASALSPDGGVVEQTPSLTYFVYDEVNRCRDASSLLNAPPARGSVTVHVGHADFTGSCPVLDSLNPAEAAIYKPQLGAPPRFMARVSPTQWATLP